MRVLVVGNGGREHAICWKLAQSPLLTKLYCASGNPGTAEVAENVAISECNVKELSQWALDNKIDLTVVGPEAPLAAGLADEFEAKGLKIFGPRQAAAQIESSKAFSKDVMVKAGVPTPKAQTFSDYEQACSYVKEQGAPIVIKADGLAAGKGVVVAQTVEEALLALKDMMCQARFGAAGATVVVEECIIGREASVMAIIDGEVVKPLVVSSDYKRVFDHNEGPNTGGMGAISPTPVLADSEALKCVETVFLPTIRELNKRGIKYRGFLYAGTIIDAKGVLRVIEFNCRLGDPETQVLMRRLNSDLLEALWAATNGTLDKIELQHTNQAAACVVAASAGYPGKVDDGKEISGLFPPTDSSVVFQAGTKRVGDKIITKGGRVLVVSATGDELKDALNQAYEGLKKVSFEGMHYRKDIGQSNA